MSGLHVAPGFDLPLDLVVSQTAILARTGAGKTTAATAIVEEVLDQKQQVVILDPPGAWHGLRSSADGQKPGYPVIVLGGLHGDVPLEASGGAVIADFVVDHGASVVIDLSEFSRGQFTTFATAFAERLYQRKNQARSPLLLVIEEADEIAPQSPRNEEARMLGAVERLVKRGRMRGVGTLLVTQRSASLNKNVLTQISTLIAMQTTAPQDREAIDAWVKLAGDQERRQTMLADLARLQVGEAYVWAPGSDVFAKIRFRLRRTFDSGATPKPGETRVEPKTVADVDLEQLRTRLSATIEKAKADDPKLLRARIVELERAAKSSVKPPADLPPRVETVVERVEVPVLTDEQVTELRFAIQRLADLGAELMRTAESIGNALARASRPVPDQPRPRLTDQPRNPSTLTSQRSSSVATAPSEATVATGKPLGRPERSILSALAQHGPQQRRRLGLLAGYRPDTGHFGNLLGSLRGQGLITADWPTEITPIGLDTLGSYDPLPAPGPELIAWWKSKISGPAAKVLGVLVDAYPGALSRQELGEAAEYRHDTGHFGNILGELRGYDLIEGSGGQMRASEALFA